MVESLKEEQKQELSEVFKIFDEKGKGHLTQRELGACFRCFGNVSTDADLQEQVNEVGGVVDLAQFVHIMTKKMKDCDVISEIKEAFKQLDSDGDRYITKQELKDVRPCPF
ncbi:hypothetical protein T484DRAFT_2543664 [Baffinella frigidus]|nr:hypothetical protein T484DRAFT_2543664 [Cryptophyta sp. CCMP2293]